MASKNLGIRLIKVDLPEPVEPINAVVVPGVALKLIFFSIASSASGYLKLTSLNSIVPLASSLNATGFSGSTIETSFFNISLILFNETKARGIITDTRDIIKKDIIICIV